MFYQTFPSNDAQLLLINMVYTSCGQVERLKIEDLRKLGNIRKVSKLHGMIALCPAFLPKGKFG